MGVGGGANFDDQNNPRDKVRNTGLIVCQVCLEDFQTAINCKEI